ncbi:lysylphosphatidylglycerol synthase transmembrane domain-containing protein [Ketobacter sp.]
MKKYLFPLKILVALAILALIVCTLDWQQSLNHLKNISWLWLLIGVLLHVSAIMLSAFRWQQLVQVLSHRLNYREALKFYWIGSLFSTVLPSNIGGDVVRLTMARRVGSVTAILTSVLMERVTGLLLLLVIGLIALILSPQIEQVLPMRTAIIGSLVIGLLFIPYFLSRSSGWLSRLAALPFTQQGIARKVASKLEQIGDSVRVYRQQPAAIRLTFALSLIFYCLLFAYQGAMVYAVGGELTLGGLMFAAPLVILISSLPISINGLGISEGAFVVLYALTGVNPEIALAAAVLRRLTITFVALLGVIPWLQERKQGATQTTHS